MSEGGWRREWTADGSPTLVNPEHGEACHNRVGAWLESRERYAHACRLPERFAARPEAPLRVLDVGTGLGLNLAAALEAAELAGGRLAIVSLERDERVLDEAARWCAEGEATGPAARWWPPVQEALAAARNARGQAVALADRHALRLFLGDARERLAALEDGARFDAIFFDPFSHASDATLWDAPFLFECARRLAPDGLLSTYSERADARLAWAAAGLEVGEGASLGNKRAGTLALRRADPPGFVLDEPSPKLRGMLLRRLPEWCAARGIAVPSGRPETGPKNGLPGSKDVSAALE